MLHANPTPIPKCLGVPLEPQWSPANWRSRENCDTHDGAIADILGCYRGYHRPGRNIHDQSRIMISSAELAKAMQNPLLHRIAAHLSWIAPVIATSCFAVCLQLPIEVHRLVTLLQAVGFVLVLFGVGCVFFALRSPRWNSGVLIPAMVGFVLNYSLILLLTQIRLPTFPD